MSKRRPSGELLVGTSGYQYEHWRGILYPPELGPRAWLAYYAQRFDAVEVNNTFYRLPAAAVFERWREETPAGFTIALKYSRYGTHMKRLKEPRSHLEPFLRRAERLGPRLGPILVQLPPRFHPRPDRLDAFLTAAGRHHRWAVEVRDPTWLIDEVYAVLRAHGAALVVHDLIEDHPDVVTADFSYLRFHGYREDRAGYPHQALSAAARRIKGTLDAGRDVYAFFNNDFDGHAVEDAQRLRRYLSSRHSKGERRHDHDPHLLRV